MRVQYVPWLLALITIAHAADFMTTIPVASINHDDERAGGGFVSAWFVDAPSKALNKAYKDFGLTEDSHNLFQQPRFNEWLNIADNFVARHPQSQVSAIAFLTKRFGDDGIAKLIEAAKTSQATQDTAVKLEEAQMSYWLSRRKSVRDVFMLLKLNTVGDDLLTYPLFNCWRTYVKRFNTVYPLKKSSLVLSLIKRYDDINLSKAVEAALKVTKFSGIAKIVQAEQFDRWISEGKSLLDVFVLLELNRAGNMLLENPLMNTFTKFTKAFNEHFRKDLHDGLITIETEMKGVPVAANYGPGVSFGDITDTEKSLFQLWFVHMKSPDKVFKLLGLNKVKGNFVASPLFATWLKFTDTYRLTYPEDPIDVVKLVRKYYKRSDVAAMISAGKQVPSSRNAAERLESQLVSTRLV